MEIVFVFLILVGASGLVVLGFKYLVSLMQNYHPKLAAFGDFTDATFKKLFYLAFGIVLLGIGLILLLLIVKWFDGLSEIKQTGLIICLVIIGCAIWIKNR